MPNVLNELANRSDIKKWVHDITKENRQFEKDLYQELFLALAEMDQFQLAEIVSNEKRLKGYVFGILKKKLFGQDGDFNRNFRRPYHNKINHIVNVENGSGESCEKDLLDDLCHNDIYDLIYSGESKEENHLYLDALERAFTKLNRFEKEIMETYLKVGKMRLVAETKHIALGYVHLCIANAKRKIKSEIENEMLAHE
jgi:DNA-directed RNA polymerase specialized sigma24 family protein